MAYTRYLYNRIFWENKSDSLKTPLGKTNLNRMDAAIYNIAENVDIVYNAMQSQKLDITAANKMLRSVPVWDKDTGILTFQFYDGTEFSIDFDVEKIPVSFSMDSAGVITMVTEDGTEWRADIGELIPDYSFEDSDRVTFNKIKKEDGSYSITADIIKGSITGEFLQPDYLSDITVQASKAEAGAKQASDAADSAGYDAKLAQSYSVGGSGIRTGEDTDNARYYREETGKSAASASEAEGKAKEYAEAAAVSTKEAGDHADSASLSAGTATQKAAEAAASAVSAGEAAVSASAGASGASASAASALGSAEAAETHSLESRSWAGGGTGTRTGEDTDNAMYYAQQAKESADRAASLSNIEIATEQKAGIVKPDGDTITIDADGTLHGSASVDTATEKSVGVVKPDGESITVDGDGTLRVAERGIVLSAVPSETVGALWFE